VPDFSIVGEAEMHTYRASIVTSIIERHAVCVRKQRIDLKGPRRGMRQLRTPVPFYLGSSAKGPSIATTDGGTIVVEIDEGRKPSFLTGIEPINDYSDRVETALGVRHWFHLLAPKRRTDRGNIVNRF
jgi:hypothetical protein